MSSPHDGDYYILNRITSAVGQPLAITANGPGKALTVTDLEPADPNQKWTIASHGDYKTIHLKSNNKGVAQWSNDKTTLILSDDGYWAAGIANDGLAIQDTSETGLHLHWSLKTGVAGEKVELGVTANPNWGQRWYLKSVQG